MDKIEILEKIKVNDKHVVYKVEFMELIDEWNFYRDSNGYWFLTAHHANLYRQELLLFESILRGLNS